MNGKSYNRGIACHKWLFEAFSRLKRDAFVKWMEASYSSLPQGSEDAVLQAIKDCANLHQDYKVSGISSEVMQQRLKNLVDRWSTILPHINEFTDISRSHSETLFWVIYLSMVELLQNYIAAKRISNFSVHIESFCLMLPWDFAYDHTNYACWGSLYCSEMLDLPNYNPEFFGQLACVPDHNSKRKESGLCNGAKFLVVWAGSIT